jgi:exonuclease VII small subunit
MATQNQHKYLEERVADLENKVADLERAINSSEPLSAKEIKDVARTTLKGMKLKIYENDSGVSFQLDRMDNYLKSSTKAQTYRYWIVIDIEKRTINCCLTIRPENQNKDVVSKMNKIISHFNFRKESVTNENGYIKAFNTAPKNIDFTHKSITKAVEELVKETIEETNKCLDKIGAEK